MSGLALSNPAPRLPLDFSKVSLFPLIFYDTSFFLRLHHPYLSAIRPIKKGFRTRSNPETRTLLVLHHNSLLPRQIADMVRAFQRSRRFHPVPVRRPLHAPESILVGVNPFFKSTITLHKTVESGPYVLSFSSNPFHSTCTIYSSPFSVYFIPMIRST